MSDISSYRVELQRAESGAAWHLELLHVVKFAPIFFFFSFFWRFWLKERA